MTGQDPISGPCGACLGGLVARRRRRRRARRPPRSASTAATVQRPAGLLVDHRDGTSRSSRSADLPIDSGSLPLMLIVPALTRPLAGRYLTARARPWTCRTPTRRPARMIRRARWKTRRRAARAGPAPYRYTMSMCETSSAVSAPLASECRAPPARLSCVEHLLNRIRDQVDPVTNEAMASAGNSVCHQ